MSGKDPSVTSREALASTGPGKQILKQGLFKSAGLKIFTRYKDEVERELPLFAKRFASDLLRAIREDLSPASTQQRFADVIGSTEMALSASDTASIRSRLDSADVMQDRVGRILNSNFVKMTFPVLNALYDAANDSKDDAQMRQDVVDGHIMAIDLSEPMDRIIDRDEDIEYLDDYKLMVPYILELARAKISRGGPKVLESFEAGFADALDGQRMDAKLKMRPASITAEDMDYCYKKYRAVMGTAGRNMAMSKEPLGEIFYLGMARAAESVGCGNEIEDSIKGGMVKVPSWPLYYTMQTGDTKRGFEATLKKSQIYLEDARLALDLLPDNFSHKEFLKFLFLTVDHYNQFWYKRLNGAGLWSQFQSNLPR